jgi:hypothetical protein
MLSSQLMQSQEAENIMRGLQNQSDYYHPSSYINNSSVAKTAVHKRRNISVGVANEALNGIAIPNIENTYDGLEHQRHGGRINTSQLNTEPQKKGYSGYLDELSRQQHLSQFNTDQHYMISGGGKGTSFQMHGGKNQLVQKLNSQLNS